MTTENKRVAAYLPQPLYNLLGEFKEENSLSESKAIISILAAHFGVAQEVSQTVAHKFVTVSQFDDLQAQVAHLSSLVGELQEKQLDYDSSLSESKSDTPIPGQTSIFEAVSLDGKSDLPIGLAHKLPGPMSEESLIERFHINNPTSIGNKRRSCKDSPDKFIQWTRKQDKDGLGWPYNPETRLYHAIS